MHQLALFFHLAPWVASNRAISASRSVEVIAGGVSAENSQSSTPVKQACGHLRKTGVKYVREDYFTTGMIGVCVCKKTNTVLRRC